MWVWFGKGGLSHLIDKLLKTEKKIKERNEADKNLRIIIKLKIPQLYNFRKPLKKPFERQSLNKQCLTNAQYEELPDLPIIITKLIFPGRKSLRTDLKDKFLREQ